ncbi:MAG: YceI family protein [Verrucomicrobiales bacterium]
MTVKNEVRLSLASISLIAFCGCTDPSNNVEKATVSSATNSAAVATASTNSADTNAAANAATAQAKEFVIMPESRIDFVGSKVTGSHDGGFKSFSGTVPVANGKIVGTAKVVIDMNSIWSDNERLTGHLKSADFFEVEKFPTSTFTVTSIEGEGDSAKINGNLELHGVTKGISFPAKVHVTDDQAHVQAEFAINRKDFGIVYAGKSDDLIRDNVVIKFDLKAAPQKG